MMSNQRTDRLESQSAVITPSTSSCENVTAKTPKMRQSKNGLMVRLRWITENTAHHIAVDTRISAMTMSVVRQGREEDGLGSMPAV